MATQCTAEDVLQLTRGYQPACVLAAAADLELFDALGRKSLTAERIARRLKGDPRATTILLDALVALRFLRKRGEQYSVPVNAMSLLSQQGTRSVLAMVQHQANCLRRWSNLTRVVKTGRPAERVPSIRGEAADRASFIGAMHVINVAGAGDLIRALRPLRFRRLLDVGGGSGTWTIAFLRAHPSARATLFDLPPVIPLARRRLAAAGLGQRADLVAGDFLADPLPAGADLAWVSAIVHQNSRKENRALFAKVFRALQAGGRIAIRDIVMAPGHTAPTAGALFAVNMLVSTAGGGTFTFDELREDLEHVGFVGVRWLHRDEGMNSIVLARKPRRSPIL